MYASVCSKRGCVTGKTSGSHQRVPGFLFSDLRVWIQVLETLVTSTGLVIDDDGTP